MPLLRARRSRQGSRPVGNSQLATPPIGSPQVGSPQVGSPQVGSPQVGGRFQGRIHRPFFVRYVAGLTLFGIVTIIGHGSLMVLDHEQTVAATQREIASNELTEAQAALGDALLVQLSESDRAAAAADLTGMLTSLQHDDQILLHGDSDQHLPAASSHQLQAYLGPDGITARLASFIQAGRTVADPTNDSAITNSALATMRAELQGPLFAAFNRAVQIYRRDAQHHERISQVLGPTILGTSLLIIIAEGPLIFLPMSRRIRTEVHRLAAAEAHQRHEADHDSLTGLTNRRHLSGLVTAYVADGIDYVLMLSDVDKFKTVNDTLGHDVGDQVLLAYAAVLRRTTEALPGRELPAQSSLAGQLANVVAGRLGGDEFLVVLPLVSKEESVVVFEAARQAFPAELARQGLPAVTTSWGVSAGGIGQPWSKALKMADNALYLAKQRGRDCMAMEQELAEINCK